MNGECEALSSGVSHAHGQYLTIGGEGEGKEVVHACRVGIGRDLPAGRDIGHGDLAIEMGNGGQTSAIGRKVERHETPRWGYGLPAAQSAGMSGLAQGVDRFDRLVDTRRGGLDRLQSQQDAQLRIVIQQVDCRGGQLPGAGK